MTENETPPAAEPVPVENAEKPAPATSIPLTLPALLFSLIALGLSIYILITEKNFREKLLVQKETLSQITQTLAAQYKTSLGKQELLAEQIVNLQRDVKKLKLNNGNDGDLWLSGKAQSLLQQAQIQLHWSNDVNPALTLLQQADETLARIHSNAIFPIRQSIAREISQLKAQPKLDIPGILSQLDAARNAVGNLPVDTKIITPAPASNKPENQNDTWRAHFENSLRSLEKIVVIRKQDEAVKPLLSSMHVTVVREHIRINLAEAEWAVLKGDDAILQHALTQAKTNAERAFDMEAETTRTFMAQLKSLQNIKLGVNKPDIQPSLDMLDTWINRQSDTSSAER